MRRIRNPLIPQVKLEDRFGDSIIFCVRSTTKIWSIKYAYVQRMGGELHRGTASSRNYRFLFDAGSLDDELTVGDYGMEDGDTIEVLVELAGC